MQGVFASGEMRASAMCQPVHQPGPHERQRRTKRAPANGEIGACYPAATVRLVEIRLLEGPNVYRLEPVVKLEVAVGRRRTWYGQREPGRHALVRLGARVPSKEWPDQVVALVAWIRRLRVDHHEGRAGLAVHRSSDPGHWIVTFPWTGEERARLLAEAALACAERDVSSSRTARLTGAQARLVARWDERLVEARTSPPTWIRDADRRVPVVSISGTNGKSTVTRLITHILLRAGRHVGTTTSDGVLVDERMVDPGDWTGPGGAHTVLARADIDVAVLETARGGIVLRGVGYESNDVSILTNVSSDHLDLQGIHTLPELAEVKATICRITRPNGRVVLNGDDPLVARVARTVHAPVAFFSLASRADAPAVVRRHIATGGRAYLVEDGQLVEVDGTAMQSIVEAARIPVAIGGLARHNVANALAAAGGARGLGASIDEVRDGLLDFRPSIDRSPGRLNIFRAGARVVIVDFAHNEAGIAAVLDVAEGIAAGAAGRAAPITVIIGTAGDRPDDTLRGIGRIAAQRAQRVVIKETRRYLRGRTAATVVGELLAGVTAGGGVAGDVPVYESETVALRAELNGMAGAHGGHGRGADAPRVIVLMCHEDRDGVFQLLEDLGARPVDVASELTSLVPRLQERSRRS
jgi:cyanophycin synthetase